MDTEIGWARSDGGCQSNLPRMGVGPGLPQMGNPFTRFNSSAEIIRLAVLMCVRYLQSSGNVENLLAERGIYICHYTVRLWWNRFGPMFAAAIRKRRIALRHGCPEWRWHLDEVFAKINRITYHLWGGVDHEGEVLEVVATEQSNRLAALKFPRKLM
jgi:putative transposase